MDNSEQIVTVRSQIISAVNSSGLSAVELKYILQPIVAEIDEIIAKNEAEALQKLQANAEYQEKGDGKSISGAEVEMPEEIAEQVEGEVVE